MNKTILLTGLLILIATSMKAQVPDDSSFVNYRSPFDREVLDYQNDENFKYEKPERQAEKEEEEVGISASAFWDAFWDIIPYILFGGVLIFVLFSIFKIKFQGLFSGNNKNIDLRLLQEEDEDITEMDLDTLVKKAVNEEDFRLAIRLQYLHILKDLSNQNLIRWSPNKTNYDYLRELSGHGLKEHFRDITFYYEYIWYGNFDVGKARYERALSIFHEFEQLMNKRA